MPAPTVAKAADRTARAQTRRDELVLAHMGMAVAIARDVASHLPAHFDVEDLIGVAQLALVRAAARYRPREHSGAPFPSYARQVIRGAVLDSARRLTPAGHNRRRDATLPPAWPFVPCEDVDPTAPGAIDAGRMTARLLEAVSWLPPGERAVVECYYSVEEPTLPQVAARLGLKYARTWELLAAGHEAVRARFRMRAA